MDSKRTDIESILVNNDRIIMDTASLMKEDGFRIFLENNHARILSSGAHLYIPGTVYQELVRHLTSNNDTKAKKASSAINLIRSFNDVFEVGEVGFSDEELQRAFADREIYNLLVNNRRKYRQLLITNDTKLGNDAGLINLIESCFGKKVSVCCLTDRGYLYEKNLNDERYFTSETKPDIVPSSSIPVPELASVVAEDDTRTKTQPLNDKAWNVVTNISLGVGMFVAGYFVCNNQKTIRRFLANAI